MVWPDKITNINRAEFCFGIRLNVFIIKELLIMFESQKNIPRMTIPFLKKNQC